MVSGMTDRGLNMDRETIGNPVLKSSMIALMAVIANAGMDIATKLVATDLSAWQGVFLRWGYAAVLLCLLMMFRDRRSAPEPKNWKVHALRLGLNLVGSASLFYALANLDLWLTLTIFFLEPVTTICLAALFIGYRPGPAQIIALSMSLIGVALVTVPASGAIEFDLQAVLVAFIGTSAWGAMHLVTERLGRDQSAAQLIFVLAIGTCAASFVPAAMTWQAITLWHHAVMVSVAILGSIYSYLWISALKLSSAAGIAIFGYLIVPIALASGHILFGEHIGIRALAGSAVIMIAVFVASPQFQRLGLITQLNIWREK